MNPNMHDTDQMLVNDARSLERAITARARKIDALTKQLQNRRARKLAERPKRYSVEFSFPIKEGDSNQQPIEQRAPPQQQSFTVDGGTEFFCTELSSSLRVVGPAQVGDGFPNISGQAVNITAPYDIQPGFGSQAASAYHRDNYMQYFYAIRDTGSDRDWQDVPQPSPFMLSGHLSALYLPTPARSKGGTKVAVEIRPTTLNINTGALDLINALQSVVVHISFHGVEVRK